MHSWSAKALATGLTVSNLPFLSDALSTCLAVGNSLITTSRDYELSFDVFTTWYTFTYIYSTACGTADGLTYIIETFRILAWVKAKQAKQPVLWESAAIVRGWNGLVLSAFARLRGKTGKRAAGRRREGESECL